MNLSDPGLGGLGSLGVAFRITGRGPWAEVKTIEVLHRSWHIEGMAVRPDHRMVAHTAFLTFARRLARSPEPESAPKPS